jgi:hypothetical protein
VLSRRNRSLGAVASLLIGALLLAATPVAATTVGTTQGCTPGYWKNHTDNWQEFSPSTLVKTPYSAAASTPFGNLTLAQALALGGGPGVAGAEKILLRAATAALLNAAFDPLLFPWQRNGSQFRPPLVATVNAALSSNDRGTMLTLATWLDNDNNLGCPLN